MALFLAFPPIENGEYKYAPDPKVFYVLNNRFGMMLDIDYAGRILSAV
jgi:hypothetical protein